MTIEEEIFYIYFLKYGKIISVENAHIGKADGEMAYCTNGDQGSPCISIWFKGNWRVFYRFVGNYTFPLISDY